MRGITIEDAAHLYDRTSGRDVAAEYFRAIGWREDRLINIKADLAPVDIKGRDDLDVTGPVRTDEAVHKADRGAVIGCVVIKADSLHERAGAIAHPDNSDSDFVHLADESRQIAPSSRAGQRKIHNDLAFRSEAAAHAMSLEIACSVPR